MDNIIEPTEDFDFSNITLSPPVAITGGAYFTKIEWNKKPLYIQTTKSLTRQGIVKSGKKFFLDLMFDKTAEILIQWFENLESKCQKLIFDKRDLWFQNPLEESDIESAFTSSIRVYKSGKYYLLRANVKSNASGTPGVKIYNEQVVPMTPEDILEDTQVISILEIQGIKFTSRNFQVEINLKQMMIVDSEKIFENCLIKSSASLQQQPVQTTEKVALVMEELPVTAAAVEAFVEQKAVAIEENEVSTVDDVVVVEEEKVEPEVVEEQAEPTDELKEMDFVPTDSLESIQLKKPNEVYFQLYKEAREKAKAAKKNAILAYLEAKNIKKTYMLDDLSDDSDTDDDFGYESEEKEEATEEQEEEPKRDPAFEPDMLPLEDQF